MIDPYALLGVAKDADTPTIQRAYRRAAKKAHPDAGGSAELMGQIVLARDVLSDPARRERYDRTGQIDETAPDQFESTAMVLVAEAVFHVQQVAERRRMDIATVDVVGDAKRYLKEKIETSDEQVRAGKDAAKKLRKFAARFSSKSVNRIGPMIDARAAEIEREIEKMSEQIRTLKRALDILGEHAFDFKTAERKLPTAGVLGFLGGYTGT